MGTGKFHIEVDGIDNEALCGLIADSGHWRLIGDRRTFEKISPDRLCKRCLLASAADARSEAKGSKT
jgi:hypothetical protein